MKKNLWLRVGMTIKLTDEEISLILSNNYDGGEIVKKAIKEGRYDLDGESYVPESSVENFNQTYGTDYVCEDYEWQI